MFVFGLKTESCKCRLSGQSVLADLPPHTCRLIMYLYIVCHTDLSVYYMYLLSCSLFFVPAASLFKFAVAVSGVDFGLREENQQVCQRIWDGIGEWNHGRVSVFLCLCCVVCVCVLWCGVHYIYIMLHNKSALPEILGHRLQLFVHASVNNY